MTSRAKKYNQYFTPPVLASKLISFITIEEVERISDFAAGDGELLRAAENRWPKIVCTAVDIDEEVTEKLQSAHPTWTVKCFDFTAADARNQCLSKLSKRNKFPAIVLNPPFAALEGEVRLRTVFIAGTQTRCSPALAFVIEAIEYLKKGGQLVAIVPHSVTESEKDYNARQLLIKHHNFEVVEIFSNTNFKGCSPRIAIIRITNKIAKQSVQQEVREDFYLQDAIVKLSIFRGTISNTTVAHSTHQDSTPFIHTTDLSLGLLHNPKKSILQSNLVRITGPAVLIPRVGKPDIHKITILPKGATVVLSDCIIALLCKKEEESELTYSILRDNWPSLELAYGGTCARFISLKGLCVFLHRLKFEIALHEPSLSSQNKTISSFISSLQVKKIQANGVLVNQ